MKSANPVFYRGPCTPAWYGGIAGELRHTHLTILADSHLRMLGINSESEPWEVGEGVPSLLTTRRQGPELGAKIPDSSRLLTPPLSIFNRV
jgi:hypothetical protein